MKSCRQGGKSVPRFHFFPQGNIPDEAWHSGVLFSVLLLTVTSFSPPLERVARSPTPHPQPLPAGTSSETSYPPSLAFKASYSPVLPSGLGKMPSPEAVHALTSLNLLMTL